jgi:hypothetical protein
VTPPGGPGRACLQGLGMSGTETKFHESPTGLSRRACLSARRRKRAPVSCLEIELSVPVHVTVADLVHSESAGPGKFKFVAVTGGRSDSQADSESEPQPEAERSES